MMDPSKTALGKMLLDQITPVVLVLRTPLVEESCRKNGLSFIEMLNPFCHFSNIDVPVRTASDQPYRLRRFKLRLFYASEIRRPNIEVAKERLKQVINIAGDKDNVEIYSDLPKTKNAGTISEPEFVPSWFQNFNKELVDAVSFSEHEAFDHPVACLVAVSSKDEDPIENFVDLFNMNQLPSLFNDGAMDPKILKYFVLVHDNEAGMLEKATGILTKMRSTFGVNDCHLLCINSSSDGLEEHHEMPWAYYKNNVSHNRQFGCFLSLDDIEELRNTMQDLSSKHIIPHMELKIRLLNQQVSVTRKGFRNQIKNLWWRKGKEDGPENQNGPMYTFSSIESQIRVLGDYAFMLQDYELALSNYRLISTDYKLDKAWKRFAGTQEIMGLCYFMLDQSRKEAEYCMENSFSTYLKMQNGVQNAARCGLWWAEMLKARGLYREAADVYFRISGEEPLRSAVMLEKASYCYLLSTPSMLRKYGFHLVLSGDLYQKGNQIKHAIRTYSSALSVFKGTTWMHIRDHVHFHIGRWYSFLGIFDEAIKNMLEVLECGHQSNATQELFLKGFFQVIQETGKTFEILRLQLPLMNYPKVIFEDHRTYASAAAANIDESEWQSLEEEIVPPLSVVKTNWLESQPKGISEKYKDYNMCVAGEAVEVDVSFRNPLQIPLSISSVSLLCKYSAESDETDRDTSSSLGDDQNGIESRAMPINRGHVLDTSLFTLSEVDILMQGGETTLVQLKVTPKTEGILTVFGVRWKLSGSVVGICNFNSDLVKKKVAGGKRKIKRSVKDSLKFLVIKSLPRLEGVLHDLPQTVYAGDLRRLTLEISNPSKISVKNLKMQVSHPRFLNIADQEVTNFELPTCFKKQNDSKQSCTQVNTATESNNAFVFPETVTNSWDTPLMWPLWFKAAVSGDFSLCITIYYEMEDKSAFITYRTLRMHYSLKVLPSLEVSFQLSSCHSRLHEFLVRMDITNKSNSESFQVRQLSCVGHKWELISLQSVDSLFSSEFLMAGQALSCFFKLQKGGMRENIEDNMSYVSSSGRVDVELSGKHAGGLFNTSISPFNCFHHHESVHQKRLEQDDQNSVDFILITESRSETNPNLQSSTKIFTHYNCHCGMAFAGPISWLMNGPQLVRHNFSSTVCTINLRMAVYNSTEDIVSVRLSTHDSVPADSGNEPASVSGSEVGWYDTSHLSDIKVTSSALVTGSVNASFPESLPPFIWCGLTSTHLNVDAQSSAEIPLQICVFSPGTYDLSSYSLHWKLLCAPNSRDNGISSKLSSGTCSGHPYHITVLQTE